MGARAAAPRGQTCPAQAAPGPARGRDLGGRGRRGRRGGGGERVGLEEGKGEASEGGARGLEGEKEEGRGRAARAGAEMRERSE